MNSLFTHFINCKQSYDCCKQCYTSDKNVYPICCCYVLQNFQLFLFEVFGAVKLLTTFRRFSSVAMFGTNYFPLKIKILAKCERELTTKFAIARNGCYWLVVRSKLQLSRKLFKFRMANSNVFQLGVVTNYGNQYFRLILTLQVQIGFKLILYSILSNYGY